MLKRNPFVAKNPTLQIIDLICQTYPNKTPSDYLEIKDDYTRLAIDGTLALKSFYEKQDQEQIMYAGIMNAIMNVCRSLGAKGIKKIEPKIILGYGQTKDALFDINKGTVVIDRRGKSSG